MLKRILVGLDCSPYSETATALGIQWCQRLEAMLIGLTVVDCDSETLASHHIVQEHEYRDRTSELRVAKPAARLREFVEVFSQACSRARIGHEVRECIGCVAKEIVAEAERSDLVLLGAHTFYHTLDAEDTEGSLLRKVMIRTPRPVVIVPRDWNEGTSVLVAYDGSVHAAHAVYALQASGLIFSDEVHVLGIGREDNKASLPACRAAEFLGHHGHHATTHVVITRDDPSRVILEYAEKLNSRLIVMGAYGQPKLNEFLTGSVTHSMLKRECTVPLFLFH